MPEMRILTVRQPWAWAIIHGGKDVENRTRGIAGYYRGPVAIHAAASATATLTEADERLLLDHDVDGKVDGWMGGEPIEGGVILGVVDLVDVHHADDSNCAAPAPLHRAVDGHWERPCSLWAEPDAYHLVLESPRALAEPIPCRGALGLRRLDDSTTAAVWSQIGTQS